MKAFRDGTLYYIEVYVLMNSALCIKMEFMNNVTNILYKKWFLKCIKFAFYK